RHFVQGLGVLPPHTQVHGEVARDLVVVLDENAIAPVTLAPLADYRSATLDREQVLEEVAVGEATDHAAVKRERSEGPVVAGVIAVLAEADELEARFDQVFALLPSQVVGIGDFVVYRAADRPWGSDVIQPVA